MMDINDFDSNEEWCAYQIGLNDGNEKGKIDAIAEIIDFFENKTACIAGDCIHPYTDYSCVRCCADQMLDNKDGIDYAMKRIFSDRIADIIDDVREAMDTKQDGESGYYCISFDDWDKLEKKLYDYCSVN